MSLGLGTNGALEGAAQGATIGSAIPGIGTAVGGIIGGGLGLLGGLFGGGNSTKFLGVDIHNLLATGQHYRAHIRVLL